MGTPEVRLLTAEDVEAMRRECGEGFTGAPDMGYEMSTADYARIVHTLEAQAEQIAALTREVEATDDERREAAAERDTWRAEAQDQRGTAERLRGEVDRLHTEADVLRAKLCYAGSLASEQDAIIKARRR